MVLYNVTYIHPTEGTTTVAECDDTRLNVVAGDTFYLHSEMYDRCHIIDVTPAAAPSMTEMQIQMEKFRPYMDRYMGDVS